MTPVTRILENKAGLACAVTPTTFFNENCNPATSGTPLARILEDKTGLSRTIAFATIFVYSTQVRGLLDGRKALSNDNMKSIIR